MKTDFTELFIVFDDTGEVRDIHGKGGFTVFQSRTEAEDSAEEGDSISRLVSARAESLTVQPAPAEPEKEYEWGVTYSYLHFHPGDRRNLKNPLTFQTEQEAEDCIAGKMDCSPQMMREAQDIRKLKRTKAGEWRDVKLWSMVSGINGERTVMSESDCRRYAGQHEPRIYTVEHSIDGGQTWDVETVG